MAYLVDKRELSRVFNISERTLTEYLKAGLPFVAAPEKRGQSYQFETSDVFRWLVEREIGKRLPAGNESLDPQQERALLDRARRREVELRLREREGELIPASVVEAEWVRLVSTFRQRLLALPSRVSPLVAAESDVSKVHGIIEGLLHECMTALSEEPIEPFEPTEEHEPPLPAADEIH